MSRRKQGTEQERIERELAALADGSLAAPRAQQLLARMEDDPRLASQLAEQRRALELIGAGLREPAPTLLHREITTLTARSTRLRARSHAVYGGALAVACATAAALVIALSSGQASGPTLAQAAAVAGSPAKLPAPAESASRGGQLDASVQGVAFPYWGERSGWHASGARIDHLSGRLVKTVFYTSGSGQRIGYAIVAGQPLDVRGGSILRRNGVAYRLLSVDAGNVVTWVERGHSCVVAGRGVNDGTLLELATLR